MISNAHVWYMVDFYAGRKIKSRRATPSSLEMILEDLNVNPNKLSGWFV